MPCCHRNILKLVLCDINKCEECPIYRHSIHRNTELVGAHRNTYRRQNTRIIRAAVLYEATYYHDDCMAIQAYYQFFQYSNQYIYWNKAQ